MASGSPAPPLPIWRDTTCTVGAHAARALGRLLLWVPRSSSAVPCKAFCNLACRGVRKRRFQQWGDFLWILLELGLYNRAIRDWSGKKRCSKVLINSLLLIWRGTSLVIGHRALSDHVFIRRWTLHCWGRVFTYRCWHWAYSPMLCSSGETEARGPWWEFRICGVGPWEFPRGLKIFVFEACVKPHDVLIPRSCEYIILCHKGDLRWQMELRLLTS